MEDKRIEPVKEYDTPAYKPRKRRFGDRKEGRRLRTLPAMTSFMPYIMRERNDSMNQFEDVIDITNVEKYLDKKHEEGYTDMALLHVILAAYLRVVSDRPGINRFVAGRRIFARNNIECVMTVIKEMSLESPDTCIKVEFDPRDDIYNVYKKFRTVVKEATCSEEGAQDVYCDTCKMIVRTEPIEKLEHTPGEWQVDEDAPCVERIRCTVCDEIIEEKEADIEIINPLL